jgi:hypothetical protein
MEIISIRKVGKRVSPSRGFTKYIGNETGNGFTDSIGLVYKWEWEWLIALQVVIASHIGIAL